MPSVVVQPAVSGLAAAAAGAGAAAAGCALVSADFVPPPHAASTSAAIVITTRFICSLLQSNTHLSLRRGPEGPQLRTVADLKVRSYARGGPRGPQLRTSSLAVYDSIC